MRLITPFEFSDEFPQRQRMAVVGNAPSLAGSGLGAHIDSHDVVVRFNECAIAGFEADVGSKTDLLVTNPYVESRSRPMLDGGRCRAVIALCPPKRRGSLAEFAAWVGDHPVLFTYKTSVPDSEEPAPTPGLTSGTFGLHLLGLLLRPRRLFCTGFDMFADDTRHHYWRTGLARGIGAHDTERETRLFARLLTQIYPERVKCRVEVTAEVAATILRVEKQLPEHLRVKPAAKLK